MEKSKNLVEGLPDEILRVTEISRIYKGVECGAGLFAASLMDLAIEQGRKALASGDIMQMTPAYNELKEFEI